MRLELSPEAEAMAAEAREFFARALPEDIRRHVVHAPEIIPIELQKRWHRILAGRGWGGHGLPAAVGGTGWSDEVHYAFLREMALADAPRPMLYGLRMLATTLVRFGTEDQKRRHLPGIMSGEVMWCQAFSEPEAGSDLAALKCRAVREGDEYVIHGTKIWITEAHWADALCGIFRTSASARKQEGITFLLVPMSAPGLEVRPLRLLEGSHEVNQIFFDGVRVPVSERVGDEGDGWRVAKYLLATERLEIAEVGRSWSLLGRMKALLASDDPRMRMSRENPAVMSKLAELEIRLLLLDATERRLLLEGVESLRDGAPLLKIEGSTLAQDLSELLLDIAGPAAQVYAEERDLEACWPAGAPGARNAGRLFYNSRVRTIYGGSTETMRNLIARSDLKLGAG